MTIAICAIVPEGIILGADSTASMSDTVSFHYFQNNQKLFEIGESSTLGMLTWGAVSFGDVSFRSLIAQLGDQLASKPAASVEEVARRWVELAWPEYTRIFENDLQKYQLLETNVDDGGKKSRRKKTARTREETEFYQLQRKLSAGFCIAGYVPSDRKPFAFKVDFTPDLRTPPTPESALRFHCWGVKDFYERLFNGFDKKIRNGILKHGGWQDSEKNLDSILSIGKHSYPLELPLRDAIDLVHFCIYSTIKLLKFSYLNQVCGGPIELAVISTDRKFRWVKHKEWDSALDD